MTTPLPHRLYRHIRPLIYRLRISDYARRLFSDQVRQQVAIRIGLRGFNDDEVAPPELQEQVISNAWLLKQRRERRTRDFKLDGVNLIGDLRAEIGLGESARSLAASLSSVQIPVNYIEVPLPVSARSHPLPPNSTSGSPYFFSIVHLNAPEMVLALDGVPDEIFATTYVIAVWYWELPDFPAKWHPMFKYVDEIWVASRYTQDFLARLSPVPVVRAPLSVTITTTNATRRDFGLPDDRFIFLFSFNPGSAVARKNPFGLIEAFRRAFGKPSNGPLLVMKVHHLDAHYGLQVAQPLQEAVESVGGVLLTDNLTREEMNDLLNVSDCYVSLHRSEGFGLGMAEAMALGKPVIATAYSANMDYMTPSNSYGVRYKLREITAEDHEYQPYYLELYAPGQIWAEPDLDHAAELMQHVYENPQDAARISEQGRIDIATRHSQQAVGKLIAARLQVVVDHAVGSAYLSD